MTRERLFAAAAQELGRRPRLAAKLIRLPRVLPAPARTRAFRSFSWPLAKRLGATAEVTIAGGGRVRVRTDDSIGRVLAISGVWEPNVTAAFVRALHPGDVCVDVGAHIGYYTLLASRIVGPAGHVYAFEPSPTNFDALRVNLELNGVRNVTARNVALAFDEGTGVLNEGPGTNTGRATLRVPHTERDTGRPRVTVPLRTATSELPERELARVRVVKIDVEGYELEVLRSLVPLLELRCPLSVFLELTPGWVGSGELEWLETLWREHRFTPYALPSGYAVEELFPARVEPPAGLSSVPTNQCDLMFVR